MTKQIWNKSFSDHLRGHRHGSYLRCYRGSEQGGIRTGVPTSGNLQSQRDGQQSWRHQGVDCQPTGQFLLGELKNNSLCMLQTNDVSITDKFNNPKLLLSIIPPKLDQILQLFHKIQYFWRFIIFPMRKVSAE